MGLNTRSSQFIKLPLRYMMMGCAWKWGPCMKGCPNERMNTRQPFIFVARWNRYSWTDQRGCSCCTRRGGETMSLNCSYQRDYCSYPRWYMSMENHSGMLLTAKHRRKTSPSATLSTQILYGLTQAWTQAFAVRGRRLTAWDMARPQPRGYSAQSE
jgi:hypothetical protein